MTSQQETDYLAIRDMVVKYQSSYVGPDKLMVVGDSIIECLVPSIIALKGSKFLEAGYAGAQTYDIQNKLYSLIPIAQPSKIILHVGANDALQGGNPGYTNFATNYTNLLNCIASLTSAPVIVSTILPWSRAAQSIVGLPVTFNGFTYDSVWLINSMNNTIKSIASARGLQIIDSNWAMSSQSGPDIGYANPALFVPDGLHPSAAGIEVLRSKLEAAL